MAFAFQKFVQPAQEMFGYPAKPYSHTQYEELDQKHRYGNPRYDDPDTAQSSPYTPFVATPGLNGLPWEQPRTPTTAIPNRRVLNRYNRLKRATEMVFGFADVCSCLLTLFIEGTMGYILVKYYRTRNVAAPPERVSPWATDTIVWPTYMLFSAALATFLFSLVALLLQCSRKRNVKRGKLTITVVKVVIHVGAWIAVAAFYRIAKTGKDLWGWSCSEQAAAIQYLYVDVLDYGVLCKIQGSSWIVSIAEAGVKILLAVIGFYYHIKLNGVKREIVREIGKAGWETFENFS